MTSTTLFFNITYILFSEQLDCVFINFHFRNTGSLKKWVKTRYLGYSFHCVLFNPSPNPESRGGGVFTPAAKMPQLLHETPEELRLGASPWLSPEAGTLEVQRTWTPRGQCPLTRCFVCKFHLRDQNITDKLHTPNRLELT